MGHAMRATVGEELVCLGGDARRVLGIESARVESSCGVLCFAERMVRWLKKGSVVNCPGAPVFGEKVRMGAERGTTDFP